MCHTITKVRQHFRNFLLKRPKLTFSIPCHSIPVSPNHALSIPVGQKLTFSIQIYCIPPRPNTTSSIPVRSKLNFYIKIYSSQTITNFLQSKLFQAGKRQLFPFQALSGRQKTTFPIPSSFSQATQDFFQAKPFQSGQYCQQILPPLLALSQLVTELFSSCLITSECVANQARVKMSGLEKKINDLFSIFAPFTAATIWLGKKREGRESRKKRRPPPSPPPSPQPQPQPQPPR
jgi:hypothetical protein